LPFLVAPRVLRGTFPPFPRSFFSPCRAGRHARDPFFLSLRSLPLFLPAPPERSVAGEEPRCPFHEHFLPHTSWTNSFSTPHPYFPTPFFLPHNPWVFVFSLCRRVWIRIVLRGFFFVYVFVVRAETPTLRFFFFPQKWLDSGAKQICLRRLMTPFSFDSAPPPYCASLFPLYFPFFQRAIYIKSRPLEAAPRSSPSPKTLKRNINAPGNRRLPFLKPFLFLLPRTPDPLFPFFLPPSFLSTLRTKRLMRFRFFPSWKSASVLFGRHIKYHLVALERSRFSPALYLPFLSVFFQNRPFEGRSRPASTARFFVSVDRTQICTKPLEALSPPDRSSVATLDIACVPVCSCHTGSKFVYSLFFPKTRRDKSSLSAFRSPVKEDLFSFIPEI